MLLIVVFNSRLVITQNITNNDGILINDLKLILQLTQQKVQLYLQTVVPSPIINNVVSLFNAAKQNISALINKSYNCYKTSTITTLAPSCKTILASNASATSGHHNITNTAGTFEVYCEMEINGGGYTFLKASSLSNYQKLLSVIYTDTTQVLFRLRSKTNFQYQPYIVTKQLGNYSNIPIAIMINNSTGYNGYYGSSNKPIGPTPINTPLGNYILVGFIPNAMIKSGTLMGFESNGNTVTFLNCDGNPNSFITLFSNLKANNYSNYNVGGGCWIRWINSALPHPTGSFMPLSLIYFAELIQGGCRGYLQSNQFPNYYGVAIGLR